MARLERLYPLQLRIMAYAQAGAGTREVWLGSAAYRHLPAAAESLELVSTDGQNSAGGTGCQAVQLWLRDDNFDAYQMTLDLNGPTPVAVPGLWRRCNGMNSLRVGSAGAVVGAPVELRAVSGGEVLESMSPGLNNSLSGGLCVGPHAAPWGVSHFSAYQVPETQGNNSSQAVFFLTAKIAAEADAPWLLIDRSVELTVDQPKYSGDLSPVMPAEGRSKAYDLRIEATAGTLGDYLRATATISYDERRITELPARPEQLGVPIADLRLTDHGE